MTSREWAASCLRFRSFDRYPRDLPEPYDTDFAKMNILPHPDQRYDNGVDEWGSVWKNKGNSSLGEVKEYPLESWDDFPNLRIPDIHLPARWETATTARAETLTSSCLPAASPCTSASIFCAAWRIPGSTIYEEQEKLEALIDLLADMNVAAIQKFADCGPHPGGYRCHVPSLFGVGSG